MGIADNGGNVCEQGSSEQETQSMAKNVAQGVQNVKSKVLPLERRFSPRLKNILQDKRPYYGPDLRRQSVPCADDVSVKKTENNVRKRQLDSSEKNTRNKKDKVVYTTQQCSETDRSIGSGHIEYTAVETVYMEDDAYLKWTNYEDFLAESNRQRAFVKVKDALRTFNKHYLHFVQVEEKRCKKPETNDQEIACGTSNGGNSLPDKRSIKRPDLKAAKEMVKRKEILYPQMTFGHLPGIVVGHKFYSRAEMVAVGFHRQWLNGIDYIRRCSNKGKGHTDDGSPLAVAIVMSGRYEDDVDYMNEVVYTGQGGNDFLGGKRQIKDQEMLRGNLALKNNMEQCIPVRLIRGHKCVDSYSGCIYTYCGLYKVVKYWAEKGVSGFNVYKYQLMRLPRQPDLDIAQVCFEPKRQSNSSTKPPGLVCEDMSFGQEAIQICVTNTIDFPPVAPAEFKYIKSVEVARNITIPPSAIGCNCKGNCNDAESCSCAQLNNSDFPYVRKDGGRLIEPMDVIFECGPRCGCGPNCINRISQRGLKYRLEVYRTKLKGWAVRSWDFIPSGAPVCEYTGVLRRDDELDNFSENEYLFDIDCWHTMNGIGGRERRQGVVSASAHASNLLQKVADKMAESAEFCIDAGSCGNVSRFINHSCEPNLFVQCVLSSHHDIRLARIVLFAAENIPPMQELTYDYGYELDSVVGPDGKVKQLPCYCGTSECRGRLY